jgi:ABC-type transport system involved in multi-copper enzyme maturation permease subunit
MKESPEAISMKPILAIVSTEFQLHLRTVRFFLILSFVVAITSLAGILVEIDDPLRLFMPQALAYYLGILLGLSVLAESYENKTLVTLILRAIPRRTIIIGKSLTLVLVYSLITIIAILCADIIFLAISGAHYSQILLFRAIISSILTAFIMIALTVLISSYFLKLIPSAVASFIAFLLLILISVGASFAPIVAYFSPFFYVTDLGTPIPLTSLEILISIIGAFIYACFLLVISMILFEKRDLENL